MLFYRLTLDHNDQITGGEIYEVDGDPLDSLLIGRSKYGRDWHVAASGGRVWTLKLRLRWLLTEVGERDTLDSLIEWLGETDEARDERERREVERQRMTERERVLTA